MITSKKVQLALATNRHKLISILLSNCTYASESLDIEMKPVFNMVLKGKETRNWRHLLDAFRNGNIEIGFRVDAIETLLRGAGGAAEFA